MERFLSIVMYFLWSATIIAVLSTTFTNFQYEDLNILAGVLLFFSIVNSILVTIKKK